MREPKARSYNTTAGRVGAGREYHERQRRAALSAVLSSNEKIQ